MSKNQEAVMKTRWPKFVCKIKGHVPKISMRKISTKGFQDGIYIKRRNKPFDVILSNCVCNRCGKFLASSFWTD